MSELVNTKEMFRHAYEHHYAIGAFNFNNMETLQAIIIAAQQCKSPVILAAGVPTSKYTPLEYLSAMARVAAKRTGLPIALHLDHGPDFQAVKDFIDAGFTSVMIDGSHHPYEENVRITKEVVEYAHARNITVEGELGTISGIEEDTKAEKSHYTDPDQAVDFVKKTGVDSLAIAIGTSHGAYKFKVGQNPQLKFDILEQIGKALPGLPIVLHGASSVNQDDVATANTYGGGIKSAIGIPEEMLHKASKMAVCKINVDTDIRIAMISSMRKALHDVPDTLDYRMVIGSGRDKSVERISGKMRDVFGSAGQAQ